MSNYNNFVSDFPGRCADLMKASDKIARFQKREVTLMLCVAMPSIIVPIERLKGPSMGPDGAQPGHPAGDWQRFEKAKSDLEDLFKQCFRGSALWPEASSMAWSFGPVSDVSRALDVWDELSDPKPLGPDKRARTVIKHVRNALAHGNVFTRGTPDIDQIILLSERSERSNTFNFLAVAPRDFRAFLDNWHEFLRKIDLPIEVVSQGEGAAA